MGKMFSFQIKVQEEHKLVTWGPYAYVRHPSYSGLVMVFAGLGIWQLAPGSWIRESGMLDTVNGKVFAGFAVLWNAGMGIVYSNVLVESSSLIHKS
jgi:protein-S-isoprenylcysteine O-methyltransferase Ste14